MAVPGPQLCSMREPVQNCVRIILRRQIIEDMQFFGLDHVDKAACHDVAHGPQVQYVHTSLTIVLGLPHLHCSN